MKKQLLIGAILISSWALQAQSPQKPFPQQQDWAGCIKPNVSQAQLNADVVAMYAYWKNNFLVPSVYTSGAYFVNGPSTDGSGKGTSESHGYGMLITALMAGSDSDAKLYFDGLYKFFNTHRSTENNELMGWFINQSEQSNYYSSASDGDMDIAYALLLAHYQWGSTGSINYLQEAKDMITLGIKAGDINTDTYRIMLGDWDTFDNGGTTATFTTRPSDWMGGHLHAFENATNDPIWGTVADKIYEMTGAIQSNYSNTTGLMPDFVIDSDPKPASPGFLEGATDGYYSWNSCRFPWRTTMDYGHYGTPEAKTAVSKLVDWAVIETGNDPEKFWPGYKLNGDLISSDKYSDMAFMAPIVTASITNAAHQTFLNDGWAVMKDRKTKVEWDGYFSTSINLLSMLFISGNWWVPTDVPTSTEEVTASSFDVFPNPATNIINIQLKGNSGGTVILSDLNGKEIFSSIITDNVSIVTYSTADLDTGVYFISLNNLQTVEVKKVLIK